MIYATYFLLLFCKDIYVENVFTSIPLTQGLSIRQHQAQYLLQN